MSVYLIIGASSGIGKQLREQLIYAEHEVIGTYCQQEPANANGFFHLNVLDEKPIMDFLPPVIDGLVYCPGSIQLKPFNRLNPGSFLADYNLNVIGFIKILQSALPALKASANASVVVFSTVAVQLGLNFHSQVAASKGALEGITKSLAAEFAPSIRVNCIAPSLTDTPLAAQLLNQPEKRESNAQRHPLKRIGAPEDIANAAEFLLSSKSAWITGQVIHVDGGMSTLKT
jgi:NAD(P)-dependent dehydrogenase (short-subunit alcohol dehydrogenase family)